MLVEEVDNGNEQDFAMHETGDDDESTLDNRKPSSRDGTPVMMLNLILGQLIHPLQACPKGLKNLTN